MAEIPAELNDAPPLVKEFATGISKVAGDCVLKALRDEYPDADLHSQEWRELRRAIFEMAAADVD